MPPTALWVIAASTAILALHVLAHRVTTTAQAVTRARKRVAGAGHYRHWCRAQADEIQRTLLRDDITFEQLTQFHAGMLGRQLGPFMLANDHGGDEVEIRKCLFHAQEQLEQAAQPPGRRQTLQTIIGVGA